MLCPNLLNSDHILGTKETQGFNSGVFFFYSFLFIGILSKEENMNAVLDEEDKLLALVIYKVFDESLQRNA